MENGRTFWRRLGQDTLLSALGSLAGILLMRGVTEPVPGFMGLVARWVGAGAVLAAAALAVGGSRAAALRYASVRGYGRLGAALAIKEAGLALLTLTGLFGFPSLQLALVALLGDILFTSAALFVPRFFVRSVRRSDRTIRETSGQPSVLVAGTGREAVHLADDLTMAGTYNVIGFLSDDPAQSGMVIGNLTVYYAESTADLDALQWRLGGIDAVFYPGGFRRPSKRS